MKLHVEGNFNGQAIPPDSLLHYVMYYLVEGARGRGRPNITWLTTLQSGRGLGLQHM